MFHVGFSVIDSHADEEWKMLPIALFASNTALTGWPEAFPGTGSFNGRKGCSKAMHEDTLNPFNRICDDVVVFILSKLSSGAKHPGDFFGAIVSCKRFNILGMEPPVLSIASEAVSTSPSLNFLKKCADAGNSEASYTLGMICFYCTLERKEGVSLLEKAANASHARALYSMAIIKFNGSGGCEDDKDLQAGVQFCRKAADLGHMGATAELGYCLAFGYGVEVNVPESNRLLNQTYLLENYFNFDTRNVITDMLPGLFSTHPPDLGLRLCSNISCRRPETKKDEYRSCPLCGKEGFCSWNCWMMAMISGHNHD